MAIPPVQPSCVFDYSDRIARFIGLVRGRFGPSIWDQHLRPGCLPIAELAALAQRFSVGRKSSIVFTHYL
jgi:hypothetical protein